MTSNGSASVTTECTDTKPLRRKFCYRCRVDLGAGKLGSWCLSETSGYGAVRQLSCIRCAKSLPRKGEAPRGADTAFADSIRAAGVGHFLRSEEEQKARAEKRAALIDSLTMDYVCAVCDRRFALLLRHWPRDYNEAYWRFSDTCSEACAVLRRRRAAKTPLPARACQQCLENVRPSSCRCCVLLRPMPGASASHASRCCSTRCMWTLHGEYHMKRNIVTSSASRHRASRGSKKAWLTVLWCACHRVPRDSAVDRGPSRTGAAL